LRDAEKEKIKERHPRKKKTRWKEDESGLGRRRQNRAEWSR